VIIIVSVLKKFSYLSPKTEFLPSYQLLMTQVESFGLKGNYMNMKTLSWSLNFTNAPRWEFQAPTIGVIPGRK
jgi:hypothetical protein